MDSEAQEGRLAEEIKLLSENLGCSYEDLRCIIDAYYAFNCGVSIDEVTNALSSLIGTFKELPKPEPRPIKKPNDHKRKERK